MGLVETNQGNIYINDFQLKDDDVQYKRQFAYIPEEPILLEEFTVLQFLQFYAALYEVDEYDFKRRTAYHFYTVKAKLVLVYTCHDDGDVSVFTMALCNDIIFDYAHR